VSIGNAKHIRVDIDTKQISFRGISCKLAREVAGTTADVEQRLTWVWRK
jgi:hypothetical protein